jgi:hypothetical protein
MGERESEELAAGENELLTYTSVSYYIQFAKDHHNKGTGNILVLIPPHKKMEFSLCEKAKTERKGDES